MWNIDSSAIALYLWWEKRNQGLGLSHSIEAHIVESIFSNVKYSTICFFQFASLFLLCKIHYCLVQILSDIYTFIIAMQKEDKQNIDEYFRDEILQVRAYGRSYITLGINIRFACLIFFFFLFVFTFSQLKWTKENHS